MEERLKETLLESAVQYRGRIINVRQDRVRTPPGKDAFREVVEHPGAVAILALDGEGKVVLLQQYRHPIGRVIWEIPAGKLEPGEDPLRCGQRELAEEACLAGENWELLTAIYTTPGFCDEKIYLYRVTGLSEDRSCSTEEDEAVVVCRVPLEQAREMIRRGEIVDAKTIVALHLA